MWGTRTNGLFGQTAVSVARARTSAAFSFPLAELQSISCRLLFLVAACLRDVWAFSSSLRTALPVPL